MATGHFYKVAADITAQLTSNAGSLIAVLDEVLDISGGSLGWEKPFTDTNVAVYRATTGNRMYLRVDDTLGTTARLRMYRTMTDANTGTDSCPNGSPQSTNWCRAIKADTTADHHFIIVGDSRYFIMFLRYYNGGSYANYSPFAFGDINSLDPLDNGFNTILLATASSTTGASYTTYKKSFLDIHNTNSMELSSSYIGSVDNTGSYMAGSIDGIISSPTCLIHDCFALNNPGSNRGPRGIASYTGSTALIYTPYYILDMNGMANQTMQYGAGFRGNSAYMRGTLPYAYCTPYAGYTGTPGTHTDGASTFAALTYLQNYEQYGSSMVGRVLLIRQTDDEPGRDF